MVADIEVSSSDGPRFLEGLQMADLGEGEKPTKVVLRRLGDFSLFYTRFSKMAKTVTRYSGLFLPFVINYNH